MVSVSQTDKSEATMTRSPSGESVATTRIQPPCFIFFCDPDNVSFNLSGTEQIFSSGSAFWLPIQVQVLSSKLLDGDNILAKGEYCWALKSFIQQGKHQFGLAQLLEGWINLMSLAKSACVHPEAGPVQFGF